MVNGVGNPDWQRRYVFSAAPLRTDTFSAAVQVVSPLLDNNGFQYLLHTVNSTGSTAFSSMQFSWYTDAAGTNLLTGTVVTVGPGFAQTFKIPCMTRYYKVNTTPVSASPTGTLITTTYGTNADQVAMLSEVIQNPMVSMSASLGASVSQNALMPSSLGGRVFVTVNHGGNNKWTAWLEYWDSSAQAYKIFYNMRGGDKGQSWGEHIWLPFAPIRVNMRNDDTVAQVTEFYMISANTP